MTWVSAPLRHLYHECRIKAKKKVSAIKYLSMYIVMRLFHLHILFVLLDCRFLQNNTITNITEATFSKLESLRYL